MGRLALFYGLMIGYITKGIFAEPRLQYHKGDPVDLTNFKQNLDDGGKVRQFAKANERIIRSAPKCNITSTSSTIQVTYGDDVRINCSCPELGSVVWYDAQCHRVSSSARISTGAMELSIANYNESDSTSYQCRIFHSNSKAVCSMRTDIAAVEKVSSNKTGLAVFLIFLAVFLVTSLCLVKKHNTRISLCMRDTCKPNDGRDGKEYDAYVSTGLTETDRKFVEAFIRNVLRKKCGYSLLVDDKNLLPKLDYSDKVNTNLHKCRRLIVIFSSSYMTHDWCMYCFGEGLRKIVDLHVPTMFIITDQSILSELRSNMDIISHIPQIILTPYQTSSERQQAIERVRQRMPPPMRSLPFRKRGGMRSPMLSDAESIHNSDVNLNGDAGTATYAENGREYTFGTPPENIEEEIQREYDEKLEDLGPDDFVKNVQTGGDVDPEKVKIHQYGARKDFYSIAMTEDDS